MKKKGGEKEKKDQASKNTTCIYRQHSQRWFQKGGARENIPLSSRSREKKRKGERGREKEEVRPQAMAHSMLIITREGRQKSEEKRRGRNSFSHSFLAEGGGEKKGFLVAHSLIARGKDPERRKNIASNHFLCTRGKRRGGGEKNDCRIGPIPFAPRRETGRGREKGRKHQPHFFFS